MCVDSNSSAGKIALVRPYCAPHKLMYQTLPLRIDFARSSAKLWADQFVSLVSSRRMITTVRDARFNLMSTSWSSTAFAALYQRGLITNMGYHNVLTIDQLLDEGLHES
jgi:hypothetical protein